MAFTPSAWPPSKTWETPSSFYPCPTIDCLLSLLTFLLIEISLKSTDLPIRKQLTNFHLKDHPSIPRSEVCQFNFLWALCKIEIGFREGRELRLMTFYYKHVRSTLVTWLSLSQHLRIIHFYTLNQFLREKNKVQNILAFCFLSKKDRKIRA